MVKKDKENSSIESFREIARESKRREEQRKENSSIESFREIARESKRREEQRKEKKYSKEEFFHGEKMETADVLASFRIEDSFKLIEKCYEVYRLKKVSFQGFKENRGNIINQILKKVGLSFTSYRARQVIQYYRIVSYLLNSENLLLSKNELHILSGASIPIIDRIVNHIKESYGLDLSKRFNALGTGPISKNDQLKIIDLSYDLFREKKFNLSEFKKNLDDFISELEIRYNLSDSRQLREEAIEIYDFIYKFLSSPVTHNSKVDFIEKTGFSPGRAHMIFNHLKNKHNLDLNNLIKHGGSLDLHIPDVKEIVEERGGKILSSERREGDIWFYISCERGHKFWSPKYSITGGSWCYDCGDRKRAIGHLLHPILESYTIDFLNKRGCTAYREKTLESGKRADVLIERDSVFIEVFERLQHVLTYPSSIESIVIDFTLTILPENIIEKFQRNYHSVKRILIIVLLCEEDIYTKDFFKDLKNSYFGNDFQKRFIKIINFQDFLGFLNLKKYYRFLSFKNNLLISSYDDWEKLPEGDKYTFLNFINLINLAKTSIDDDKKYKKLIELNRKFI